MADLGDQARVAVAVGALMQATVTLNKPWRKKFLDQLEEATSGLIDQANELLEEQEAKHEARTGHRLDQHIHNPYEEN